MDGQGGRRGSVMAYGVQDQNEYAKVKVNAGTYHETGQPQTDFIITEPGRPRCAGHLVIDVNGSARPRAGQSRAESRRSSPDRPP